MPIFFFIVCTIFLAACGEAPRALECPADLADHYNLQQADELIGSCNVPEPTTVCVSDSAAQRCEATYELSDGPTPSWQSPTYCDPCHECVQLTEHITGCSPVTDVEACQKTYDMLCR